MILACPTCGADVEFRYDDSFVRVCGSCRAAVARHDRDATSLGQVADLAPSSSPLRLWLEGRLPLPSAPRGLGFLLVGRAQLAHGAGGTWEEWYAKFDDGRWGWLAEAQGRFYVTFEVVGAGELPPVDALRPGAPVPIAGRPWTVGEVGTSTALACEGELPYRFAPGARTRFADLGDGDGGFGTLDYGDADAPRAAPTVYLGRQVTLDELGWAGLDAAPRAAAATTQGRSLRCAACGGSIELRSDGVLRVVCPYCDALLEPDHDAVRLVAAQSLRVRPLFPLGSAATFDGVAYTLVGFVRRYALDGTERWPFDEYLLHAPAVGYRWLVRSDDHWTFVTTLPPGAVTTALPNSLAHNSEASYRGVDFRQFSRSLLEVAAVHGEVYWRVAVGQQVLGVDYVAPPAMLSCELDRDEVNWSLGVYLTRDEVRAAFGDAGRRVELPAPSSVGACQPYAHRGFVQASALAAGVALLVGLVAALSADERSVTTARFLSDGVTDGAAPPVEAVPQGAGEVAPPPEVTGAEVFFTEPFALRARENVELTLSAPVDNEWLALGVDLVEEATGTLRAFDLDLEFWRGVEAGEAWTEGSRSRRVVLGAGPAGTYVLRLEVARPPGPRAPRPLHVDVTVRQDVFRAEHLLTLLAFIGLPGAWMAYRRRRFERRRADGALSTGAELPTPSTTPSAS